MTDIEKIEERKDIAGEGAISQESDMSAKIAKLKYSLGGFWSVNWNTMLSILQEIDPKEEEKGEYGGLVISYIQRMFQNGNFTNLEGIDPVLNFLNITNVEFTQSYLNKLLELYARYSMSFLLDMSPTLYSGKLRGGEEYNKIEYTRGLLQQRGASPEELTDEYIEDLWSFREVLVKLHENRSFNPQMLKERQTLIGVTRLLSNLSD